MPPPVGVLEAPLPTIHSGRTSDADEQRWPVLSPASVESRGTQVLERHLGKSYDQRPWHYWRRRRGKQLDHSRDQLVPNNLRILLVGTLLLMFVAFVGAYLSALHEEPPLAAADITSDDVGARPRQHRSHKLNFDKLNALNFDKLTDNLNFDKDFWSSARNHAGFDLLHL